MKHAKRVKNILNKGITAIFISEYNNRDWDSGFADFCIENFIHIQYRTGYSIFLNKPSINNHEKNEL